MRDMIATALSVAIGLCLLSGNEGLAAFGFYVSLAFNVLAWFGVIAGGLGERELADIRKSWWIQLPSTIFSIYALIFSGHTVLAASSFVLSMAILAQAFKRDTA